MALTLSKFAVLLSFLLCASANLPGVEPKVEPIPVNKSQPVVVVTASYPGANALDVAENVGTPIEQEVNGVEDSIQMLSRCGNDGSFVLAVTFKPGTDIKKAQQLVQNRVARAEAKLPEEVKRQGVWTSTKLPVRMLVTLTSADGKHDTLTLSNLATLQVKDGLAKLAGVSEITLLGDSEASLRIWLDPDKVAAHKLTPAEVVQLLRDKNRQVPAGRVGRPPLPDGKEFKFEVKGPIVDPDKLADLVIHKDDKGNAVRLKDVARLELGPRGYDSQVSLNGKTAVLMLVYPTDAGNPRKLSEAMAAKVAELRAKLPKGVQLDVAADFSAKGRKADEYVLVDVQLPDGASLERIWDTVARCDQLLRKVEGVQDVLAMTRHPFDNVAFFGIHPCLLVRLTPADKRKIDRDEVLKSIRKEVKGIVGANVRVRDLSRLDRFPQFAYPIDLAIVGSDPSIVSDLAQKLAKRMRAAKELTDVGVSRGSSTIPAVSFKIDREMAATHGVSMVDIHDAIEVHLGSVYVTDFNRFGRNWQVFVQTDVNARKRADDIEGIKIRTPKGETVSLGRVVSVITTMTPTEVTRMNLQPMAGLTATPAPGIALERSRAVCEAEFEKLRQESRLPKDYWLTWLHGR
jgi:multidrug efflux pump subunit AcrB